MYIQSIKTIDSNGSLRHNINLNNQINIVPKELISLKELTPFLNFIFCKNDYLSLDQKQLFDNLIERLKIPNSNSLKDSRIKEITFHNYENSNKIINLYPTKQSFIKSYEKFWKNQDTVLNIPILTFYSKELIRPYKYVGRKINELFESGYGLSQAHGYYKWEDPRRTHLMWRYYFKTHWINRLYGNDNHYDLRYLSIIKYCLITFTYNLDKTEYLIKDMLVQLIKRKEYITIIFQNEKQSTLDSLPEDLKFLIYIIFDLANRWYLLNSSCMPSGICFIDDFVKNIGTLDPYLVLNALHMTFPEIQFIVNV